MFDNSHDETAGAADWVLDGGFSDFADALVAKGYTVREYRGVDKNGDGAIRYYDDRQSANVDTNEAIITYDAIKDADVFVMAEANRPLRQSEYAALKQFVDSGKGLFLIADHYNSDRNMNTWDSTEVYDGYNRSTDSQYNIGGVYGDMRNPQSATSGWLDENFGLRFRFNAIDCKNGVSGIRSASDSEGITNGVKPILMAAGSTLAITDPSKAKGIIYFSSSDSPVKWTSAADTGLYYGGEAEGPYVAISKPSAGKAAFIGDSSPIEDNTPKYLREDTGKAKSTYSGWTDTGNAATLCVNIINWLSTQESYTSFDGVNHTKGTATPNPMADVEKNQTQSEPWATPSYDPWNTDTFANGSYGAPNASGGSSGGSGSGSVSLAVYPAYVYVNEPFAIIDGGTGTNPQFGAYNSSSGAQIGQLLVNGNWTSSGYNTISGTGPLAATARVASLASSTVLKLKTSDTVYDKKTVTGLSTGYGYIQGAVSANTNDVVTASQNGVVLGTAQVDSSDQVKIAVKSGSGITLSVYSPNGTKESDLSGTYTVSNGATTTITGGSSSVPVASVSLDKTSLSLNTGDSSTLTATVYPTNATNQNVSWSSSNTSVATVNNGTVTAVAAGTATITVTTEDGNKTASCSVTVTNPNVAVTSVGLDKTSLSLNTGDSSTLTATVYPTNATNQNVSWSSSNTSVATVNNGTVTAVAAGTATITVTTADGNKTASCSVTVTNPNVAVTSVGLDKTSLSLTAGNSSTLTATVYPTNATNQNVTWSSSNTSVATVSNGTVTAVAAGTATITVTTADGNKTASCSVTVTNPNVAVTSVGLDKTSLSLNTGDSSTLTATVYPTNATNQNVSWSSSNTSVATVNNGTVTAVAAGTAAITVTTADGNKTASCSVTVTNPSGSTVSLAVYPAYVYVNEPFAIIDGGTAANPQFGAYNSSTGTQIGQLLINGSWTSSGYNTISGTGPLAATARVVSLASSTVLKIRTSDSSTYDKQTVTGLSSGYGYIQGTVSANTNDVVTASQNGVVLGTAQVDSGDQVKIAVKSGSGITLSVYSPNGTKESDLPGTYTVSNGATTTISGSGNVAVTSVGLDKTSLSLTAGSSSALTATVYPTNATNQNVTWSSSNTSVATVNNGTVTAVAAGTATITVTTADGSKTASCSVTVTNPASGDTYEPNDTLSGAYAVSVGCSLNSYIYSSSDVDYYKFTVTSSGTHTISLTNLPADYDIALYDSQGSNIDYSENSGTTSESMTDTLSAGTYYIEVTGYNGAHSTTTAYHLTIN